MKTYDKKNNDTYVEKYSNDLVLDVEIHMFKNPNGNVVAGPGVFGDFSGESRIAAKNNVLHFTPFKDLGLKNLKNIELKQFIPLSLKKRYEKTLEYNFHVQKTPIYYNPETFQFLIPSDYRLLRDFKEFPMFKESLKAFIESGQIKIISANNQENLLFAFDSIKGIEKNYIELLQKVNEKYIKATLDLYSSQDVIVISYHLDNNKETISPGIARCGKEIFNFIKSSTIDFYFLKAKYIEGSGYYIYDQNDELIRKNPIHLNREKREANPDLYNTLFFIGTHSDYLTIPYSKEDWIHLCNLKDEIKSIFSTLSDLLKKQKTNNILDTPIKYLDYTQTPLLENHSNNKNKP